MPLSASTQGHVFDFFESCTPEEQEELLTDLKGIDVHRVKQAGIPLHKCIAYVAHVHL